LYENKNKNKNTTTTLYKEWKEHISNPPPLKQKHKRGEKAL
jgi:hypothetical protein